MATTQSPSSHHHTPFPSTITTIFATTNTLESPSDAHKVTTAAPSHHLAAMVSIHNPLQHQFQALQNIKELLETLLTLIEHLVKVLTTNLNYPKPPHTSPLMQTPDAPPTPTPHKTSCTQPLLRKLSPNCNQT